MKRTSRATEEKGEESGCSTRTMELLMEFVPLYHRKLATLFHGLQDPGYHCTKNQIRAVMILNTRGRESPSRLGECLDMRRGSLTSLVGSLEAMGLVRRAPDPQDRRRVWLSLTEEGKAYVRRRYTSFQRALSALLDPLPRGEKLKFNDSLDAVVGTMKKL